MCCTCRLGQPPPSQCGTLLYFQLPARFGGPPWWAIMPPLTSKRAASRPIPILAARPSFAPKAKRCPTSSSPTSIRSTGSSLASMATTCGRPNRSNRGFRLCEICAPRSSVPLKVRFGTDSAMTSRLGTQVKRNRPCVRRLGHDDA